ncbi:uncharacterized protein LOC136074500 [Hydra vulgaris]|uniref:Uncharacterized protein LOC136074500 n=1 Tax=Hydra vulgaris TaxID=6087 RepID=A0ABM4B290_HYDVU
MGGGQGKVYIRSIQKSLSTITINEELIVTLNNKCLNCRKDFFLNELRSHIQICFNVSSDENDDVFELPLFFPFKGNDNCNNLNNNFTQQNCYSMQPLPQYELPEYESPNVNLFLPILEFKQDINESDLSVSSINSDKNVVFKEDLDTKIENIIQYCHEKNISENPVEILRYMQKKLITGRPLKITDLAVCPDGETSFILVDRSNILTTAFKELLDIKNKLITLEVQFYNEITLITLIIS